MFCPKCGNKLPDDADFCTQCGARLTRETAPNTGTSQPAGSGKAAAPKEKKPKKKRGKKVVIGVAAVVAVLAVVLVGGAISDDNSRNTPTLFDLAEGVAPMAEYGYDATYGDVLDWLIAGEKISLQQDGSVAYLTYSGNVTGGDHPVSVVLEMTGLSVSSGEDADLSRYQDFDQAGAWAIPALQWAAGDGIIQGKDDALDPRGQATRAQAATMLQRFFTATKATEKP